MTRFDRIFRSRTVGIGATLALMACIGLIEQANFAKTRQTLISHIDPAAVAMTPAPINADWIIDGRPITTAAEIAHTDDGSTKVYVWQTTASTFHWNYGSDEIVQIVDGEAFVADQGGPEHRLGPGDVAFFPVGATTTWRVPDHVKKIATLKRPMPGPVAIAMRWMSKAKTLLKPESAFASN